MLYILAANMQLPDGHGGDECTIKIDNVADNTHREALENHFLICGPIKSIQIFAAQHQAYVEFFYKVSALTALPLNGTMILGAPVRVTLKKPPVGTKADLRKLPLMLPIAVSKFDFIDIIFIIGCIGKGNSKCMYGSWNRFQDNRSFS